MTSDTPTLQTKDGELFETVRLLATGKGKLRPAARDKILFAAIADLRDDQKAIKKVLDKIVPAYQVLAAVGGISLIVIAGVVTAMATGDLALVRMP
jgi:hypothetical protein